MMKHQLVVVALMVMCGGVVGCGQPATVDLCATRAAGDLVVTEVMVDPDGSDTGAEWVELYNATSSTLELKGLTLYTKDTDGTNLKTHTIKAGSIPSKGYFVLGDVRSGPNPAWVNESYADSLGSLGNARGSVGIRCGTTVLDEMQWASAAKSARSRMLAGDLTPSATTNDDPANWCDTPQGTVYFTPNAGTPGAANPACPVEAQAGTCLSNGVARAIVAPSVGDLVITEVMNNPSISETSGEWFEVLARTSVDLNDVVVANGTGSDDTFSSMNCLRVNAGQYAVLARNADSALNGGLTNVLATYSVGLTNGAERLSLRRGDAGIDEAALSTSTSGRSWQLDPAKLDIQSNDSPSNFCVSPSKWSVDGGGDYGSPGKVNPSCSGTTTCSGHTPGDLIITEVMIDPDGADTGNEWFEVYNPSDSPADLTGVTLYTKDSNGTTQATHTVSTASIPGHGYFVFGDVRAATNPTWVDYSYGSTFAALTNTAGRIGLSCGTSSIDEVSWSIAAKSARSRMFNGAFVPDAGSNDVEGNWCDTPAGVIYVTPNAGTPGEANPQCVAEASTGTCLDNGSTRPIVPPAAGDLFITEVMAAPTISSTTGEWFEVFVRNDVDLNDMTISNSTGSSTTVTSQTCLRVHHGDTVVLARSLDPFVNGGLPPPSAQYSLSLANGNERLILRRGDAGIDEVSFFASKTAYAWQFDWSHYDGGIGSNDDPAAFCAAQGRWSPDGGGDYGSPGMSNPPCFGRCVGAGGVVRATNFVAPGDLAITEWLPDPVGVNDPQGEYFEVRVTRDCDLNGLVLADTSSAQSSLSSAQCLAVTQGSYLVFAKNPDQATNGGLPKVDFVVPFDLNNSTDTIHLRMFDGGVLDDFTYTASTYKAGVAWQLKPAFSLPADNDTAANLCATPAGNALPSGDLGTPGRANVCP